MNVSLQKNNESYPLAYQRGIQDFYGRDFMVTPDVLIPRPETEQIIDAVLSIVGKPILPGVKPPKAKINSKNLKIIDVGTGSGCIAITLKKELPESKIFASDISEKALKIAQKNAKNYDASITFIISHLLKNVNFTPDVIVANLPYVDENWDWLDKKSLSFEPKEALYAKEKGLALIYELIDQASDRTIRYLILEADPCQHNSIVTYAEKKNFSHVETRGYIITLIKNPVKYKSAR